MASMAMTKYDIYFSGVFNVEAENEDEATAKAIREFSSNLTIYHFEVEEVHKSFE